VSRDLSIRIRDRILDIALRGHEGHIASSFSIVEILIATLIGEGFEDLEPAFRVEQLRRSLQHFVLSKGHAALALYAVLLEFGVLRDLDLENFASTGSRFGGHPTKSAEPPIAASTGTLGHGLPVCAGMAYSALRAQESKHFLCLCGDGEINEGSIWESLLLINKFALRSLTIIIDNNASSTRAIDLGNIAGKLSSFGLQVFEVDGHDVKRLRSALSDCVHCSLPTAIVANTTKGHGSSVTKNSFAWHHRVPSADEIKEIRRGYYL